MHKNTVQYQLRKIAEATGFDPRRMDHAAIFQMALLLIPDETLTLHAPSFVTNNKRGAFFLGMRYNDKSTRECYTESISKDGRAPLCGCESDMKVIIAADSFKGSCSAEEAVSAMERGVHKVFPDAQTVGIPVADGGEGTVDALVAATGREEGLYHGARPTGPPHFRRIWRSAGWHGRRGDRRSLRPAAAAARGA